MYDVREMALNIVYRIFQEGGYSNIALNDFFKRFKGDSRDRSLITELVYGTVERKNTLDWIISKFSHKKLNKIDPLTLNILRLSIYQIFYLDRIPVPVVVSEAVNNARRMVNPGAAKFVNGLLRNLVREKSNITYPDASKEPMKYISIRYSHPEWLVNYWLKYYSCKFVEELCKANNIKPPLTVRVNTLKISVEEAIKSLEKDGFKVTLGKFIPEALNIFGTQRLTETEAYIKGWIQPQDEGSMLVAHMLSPQPGQFVIDVCAGPGGKTTHIAQLMMNQGKIISRDIFRHKIALIEALAMRLGINIVETELSDGMKTDDRFSGCADRVLVDTPCMGFGIIRRKPDIKWNRKPEDVSEIVKIQKQILAISADYVKPGGMLVYSTCSIGPAENNEIIADFLRNKIYFEVSDISSELKNMFDIDTSGPFIQLYPHIHGTDGFFVARLVRNK